MYLVVTWFNFLKAKILARIADTQQNKQISSTAHQGRCLFNRTLFIYKTHLYKSLFHPSPPWQGRLLTPSA